MKITTGELTTETARCLLAERFFIEKSSSNSDHFFKENVTAENPSQVYIQEYISLCDGAGFS
jgi:hypothetical protein